MSATEASVSALGPVDPASVPEAEEEKAAPWIVRKLVGSMTGRIVMSSWETLRASGTSIVCLSPGGAAAVASPVMGPISDAIVATLGDTILVEMGVHAGFEVTTKIANDLVLDKAINAVIPIHSATFETTGVKELLITLKYKHTMTDASLGFYRSSLHEDSSLFTNVMDYFSIEKGWFSPYLFASGRRPIIPRTMNPDVVFCHGPFVPGKSDDAHTAQYLLKMPGDYRLGETLLSESAFSIIMAAAPSAPATAEESAPSSSHLSLSLPEMPHLSNLFSKSRSPSPEPALTPLVPPPVPRRMVIVVVGLKPHRAGMWTTSQRPSESVMYYQLLNGCPAVVVPVKLGSPLVAWDSLTLEELWKVPLPKVSEGESLEEGRFGGIVNVLCEYLDLCVDWARMVVPDPADAAAAPKEDTKSEAETKPEPDEFKKKSALKQAVTMLLAGAIRSGESKAVTDKVDKERSGIAMWRIP
ncbi:hypothetical protein EIP86_008553 [Pleurotus ostreatoroseus]|nr:hypothetical protein EIP86_008553 [Pleurotus ostreatoroseus]